MSEHIPIFPDQGQTAPFIHTPPFPPIPSPPIAPAPTPEPEPAPPPVVPPEPEPTLTEALPDLGKLAWLIVLLGLIALGDAIRDFLMWLFSKMLGPLWPRTGRKGVDSIQLTQGLSSALGKHYPGLESDIGLSFNKLGQMTNRVGRAILAGEQVAYQIAVKLARMQQHASVTDAGVASARQTAKSAQTSAHHAGQAATAAVATAAAAAESITARLDGLTEHVTHVIEPELEALRHKIPALEKGAATAWDELRKHEEALGLGALTAATAVAMGRLGAGWTRCETNQRLGKFLCGSPPDLMRALLSGVLDALVLSDICDIADLAARAAEAARPAMIAFVDAEDALVNCHGATRAAPIKLRNVSPTPVVAALAL